MNESEFDKFADEYQKLHQEAVKLSGESTAFFADYKVRDAAKYASDFGSTENLTILDFGSGIGTSTPYFKDYFHQCRSVSLDVSFKSLTISKRRFGDISEYVYFNGNSVPLKTNCFDLVFTACVFHHIPAEQHQVLFLEIHRVLKPGGLFIIFEHNPYNFLTVRAVNKCPFDDNAKLIRGNTIKRSLKQAGFTSLKLSYRIFFPAILSFLRPLENKLTRIPMGAQYYVGGQKRST